MWLQDTLGQLASRLLGKLGRGSSETPWLDGDDWDGAIVRKQRRGELSEQQAQWCRSFAKDGYLVVRGLVPRPVVDRAWEAYDRFYQENKDEFAPSNIEGDPLPERYLNTHYAVPEVEEILKYPPLIAITDMLFGRATRPFQTITSHKGTEQGAHSDSIHMSTVPRGFLLAAWIACEEIHPDSGPLEYYPGSHRLPYVLSEDVQIDRKALQESGYELYHQRYEPHIRQQIHQNGLQAQRFLCDKGDALIWHANLLHGATRRNDLRRSRKSVVCHFFAEGVRCYHDLSGKDAVFDAGPQGRGVAVDPVSQRT